MKYKIEELTIIINGKQGFAIMDQFGHCVMIVYGKEKAEATLNKLTNYD